GMLSAAEKRVLGSGFFSDSEIYIDGFTAFTAQQYALIKEMMRGAMRVCITLGFEPDEDKNEPAFLTISNTNACLLSLAEETGAKTCDNTVLRVPKRAAHEELSFLSQNLWDSSRGVKARFEADAPHIKLITATNAYSEAEAVANDIARTVQGGARYRDIAVIMRSIDEYDGIIDAVFDKYEIPYFVSKKTDIGELSLIKFIMCALDMSERGFYPDSLIGYIKTGLCDVCADDCYLFENYVHKWNISGNGFTEDFSMSPRGLEERFTDEDAARLARINNVRKSVVEPLTEFSGPFGAMHTVRERATALYDFLSGMRVPEKLAEIAKNAKAAGDAARSSTLGRVWRAFCDALDTLVISVGDNDCDIQKFRTYLKAVLSETDIGRIPTSIDQVLIADAVLTGVCDAESVYVIGCYDGGFPHKVGDDGIFTEKEKDELEAAGISISSRLERKLSDEMFYFYRAVSSARENLTLTRPLFDPKGTELYESLGVKRIKTLFEKINEIKFEDLPADELIYGKRAAFEQALKRNDTLGSALKEYFSHDADYADRLKSAHEPMSAENCKLDETTARELLASNSRMSSSKLEKYVKCRFSYFCDYKLKLSDDSEQQFAAVNVGNFMHKMMEVAVKYVCEHPASDGNDIKDLIFGTSEKYISDIFCGLAPGRIKYYADYLCMSACAFVEKVKAEIESGGFTPHDFELVIGDGKIAPLTIENGASCVTINGKIDRVDVRDDGTGELAIRICDYKTGTKKLDVEKIKLGLDMQMLLYMFAICENGERYFGKKTVPSAIEYVMIKLPNVNFSDGDDASPEITKSGLYISDDADGKKKNIISRGAFDELRCDIEKTVLEIADELRRGEAQARPMKIQGEDPCKYCRFAPVCRVCDGDNDNSDSEET
ncbi:MAG: exodeoxyribonuclease V subunit gamma, partial [Clostridiales bacterium]|nr:exodeoxyribonuclease V subunit gamma [Clostridiales bacterium]